MWALFGPTWPLQQQSSEPYKPQRFFTDEAIFGEEAIREE
jgi:hypothetical protein